MNLKLLLVLSAVLLTGCASPSVRDDSPASDLDALVASVRPDLVKTLLPNGKEYCAELATTERQQDDCLGDLEDGLFSANKDKDRALRTLLKGVARLKLARNPCRWYQLTCRREARALDRPED